MEKEMITEKLYMVKHWLGDLCLIGSKKSCDDYAKHFNKLFPKKVMFVVPCTLTYELNKGDKKDSNVHVKAPQWKP